MIRVTVDSRGIRKWLGDKADLIYGSVFREMLKQTSELARYIRQEKLSGQVLKNRTGTLRRSIFTRVTERAGGGVIEGEVVSDRSVAKYARIHEYGGTIRVPAVSGKLMVFTVGGKTIFTQRHRAFTVKMPERSFMRSALADKKEEIMAALADSVKEALR